MNIPYIHEKVKKWAKDRYRPTCWIWQDYFEDESGYGCFVEQIERDVKDGIITDDMSDDEVVEYVVTTLRSNHGDGKMLVAHIGSMLKDDFD